MNGQNQAPLEGLRVVDLGFLAAGPWTGALLGMLGAEVIKVESPRGDGARWLPPTQRGSGMGTYFVSMNFNKKDIVLDLKSAEGHKRALELAATCDVFVQNFRVGTIERLGLDYESIRRINPRIIYCAISGYGEIGPLAKMGCIDATMQAFSGFARGTGAPGDDVEAFRFTGLVDLATASVATEAVLAALAERDTSGKGQKVSVSMLEATLEMQFTRMAELLGAGQAPIPRGSESPGIVPDRAFQTLDHEIFVTAHSEKEWTGFCKAIERADLLEDTRFTNNVLRVEHRKALYGELEPVFRARPAIWWLRVLQRHGVPSALAHNFETFRHHQQVVANDMIARIATPDWGEISVGGAPWHFSQTRTVHDSARLGDCTKAVLTELAVHFGANTEDVLKQLAPREPRAMQAGEGSLLRGLRVVEFAEGVAGPLAALRLGDLGAEVVKVESAEGDWLRGAAPRLPGSAMSAAFFELNRGKRSVALGGEPRAAQPLLQRLIETADVFITDRSDKELRALGIDGLDREPFALNPRLVMVSLSPWGRQGPWCCYKGSELTAQAVAGYTRYLGRHGEPARRLGADVASVGTGIFACQAVLAALFWRNRSGRGQRVSLSLLNSLLTMKTIHLACQSDPDLYIPPRVGAANNPPDRGWKVRDGRIYFTFGGAVGDEGRPGWVQFIQEVGLSHLLEDARFYDKTGRNSTGHGVNAHELHAEYEQRFVHYSAEELVAKVRKHMGTAARYQNAERAICHPQTQALNIVRAVPSGGAAELKVRAFPARFSELRVQLKGIAPQLGADSKAVAEELGLARTVRDSILAHGGLTCRA